MRAEFRVGEFRRVWSRVASASPRKSPKVVLQSVRLDVGGGGPCRLSATDLAVWVSAETPAERVDRDGSALLHRDRLDAILRAADPSETLRLDGDPGGKLAVVCGRARYALATEDPGLFPGPPEPDGPLAWSVAARDLARLIALTVPATDPKSSLYALGGCLLESADSGRIALVGTDGRRLANATCAAERLDSAEPGKLPPILAAPFLAAVGRFLADADPGDSVRFGFEPSGKSWAWLDGATILGRLVEGRFPLWREIRLGADEIVGRTEPAPADRWHAAIAAAAVTTGDETRSVDLALGSGPLLLSAAAADVGESAVELDVPYSGPDRIVAFQPGYLLPILATLGDAPVRFEFGAEIDPFTLHADGLEYIVMPMTRDRAGARGAAA